MAYNTSGSVNQQFVSALTVHDRDVYKKLFQRDPELSFFNAMRSMAMMSPTSQRVVEHYEASSIFQGVTIGAAPTVVNGDTTMTFSVDPSEVTNGRIYPLVGNVLEFADGQQGRVNTIAGSTVTVTPLQRTTGGAIVPFTVKAAGTKAMCFSSGFGDETDQPGSRRRTVDQFTATTQIFKNTFNVSGAEESSTTVFQIDGKASYSILGEHETAERHLAEIDLGLLFNKGGQGVDENGNDVFYTKGLLQYARDRGVNSALALTAMTDFDTIIRSLNKLRAPSEYALWNGLETEIALDNLLQGQKYYEGIQYTNIGGKQNAEALGFQSYKVHSYSLHGNRLDAFNHDRLSAQAGFSYPKTMLGVPLAKTKDPKTGQDSWQVNIRHKEGNGINRYHKVWETGANSAQQNGTVDTRQVNYRSELALQVMGADLLLFNTKP